MFLIYIPKLLDFGESRMDFFFFPGTQNEKIELFWLPPAEARKKRTWSIEEIHPNCNSSEGKEEWHFSKDLFWVKF